VLALLAASLLASGGEGWAESAPRSRAAERASGRSVPAAEAQNAATAALEEEVVARINQIRQDEGLKPLRVNCTLTTIARGFSRQMATENFFSHESPTGETLEDRIRVARLEFSRIGENIYKCTNLQNPAESAVKAWMNSPGHRHNILTAEYTEAGLGVWKQGKTFYFTQDFLNPRF
jgi:uncharacterized protein YkwD